MGLFGSFLKQRRPKQFNFQPRYYDEAKENHEKRMRRIKQEIANEANGQTDGYVSNIKGAFRRKREETTKIKRRSNMRVLVILGGLIYILYHFILND